MAIARADVVVSGEDLKAGRLPKISPLSGQLAEESRLFKFRTAPQWAWALIAGGILIGVGWVPGIIVMLAVSKRAKGPVYLTAPERSSIRVKQIITWGLLAIAILGFATAFTVGNDYKGPAVMAALVATIGWLICILAVLPRIGPKAIVRKTPSGAIAVELKQVHPSFADAVRAMSYAPSAAAPVEAPA
jgi:hypothetical protein